MAYKYNILKHRRGTTQEWLESTLVPEEGEIVIEECFDGICKCKVGDGHSYFSELSYVDEATQIKLLKAIDELRTEVNDQLTNTHESLTGQLKNTEHRISEIIQQTKEDLIDGYKNNDNSTVTHLENKIEKTSESLRIETEKGIAELSEQFKVDNNNLRDTFTAELTNSSASLNAKITASVENLSASTQKNISELSVKFTEALQKEVAKRESLVQELNQNISDLDNSINKIVQPSIEQLDNKFTSAVENLTSQHNTDIDQITAEIDSKIIVLDNKISEQAKDFDKALVNASNALTSDYSTKIIDAETAIHTLINDTHKVQTESLDTLRENTETALANTENKWESQLTKIHSELTAADALFATMINSLEQRGQTVSEDILTQLKTLHQKVIELNATDNNILNKLEEFNTDNAKTATLLTNEIDTLKQTHITDYAKLILDIAAIEEAQKISDISITNSLLDHVAKIYLEIADLVDDDITILKRLFAVEAKLSENSEFIDNHFTNELLALEQKLARDIAAAEQNLTTNIESVNKLLTDNLTVTKQALTENIETLRSNTNLKISNNQKAIKELTEIIQESNKATLDKFAEMSNEVLKNKTEVEQAITEVNVQLEDINSQIATTNNKLAQQSQRISNIISLSHGSTTGDAELMDIRTGYNGLTHASAGDAVRAIGNDLEALKASLPDYIPSNAVDGLLYEDNLLYLTSDGVPVSDPVEITGGGTGTGSVSTVRVTNNLASTSFTIAKGNIAEIDFTYTSFENEVPTGDGVFTIVINNKNIEALSGNVQHGVAKRVNITEYLKNGTNTVKVTCTDQYGTLRSLVYNISVVELRIESSFDCTKIFDDVITFRYKIFGQIEKVAHVLIDGEEISTKKISASVSGSESTLKIPKQQHGCHKITAYISAVIDETDIRSNVLEYEIICVESENNEAILASVCDITEVTQGDLISIPYMIYDPTKIESTIDFSVYSQVAGELILFDSTSLIVNRTQKYWKTRNYPVGIAVFKISYTYDLYGVSQTISKEHTIKVKALEIDIKAEEDGLQLYLSTQGRSNDEENPAVWSFKSDDENEPEITTTFTNFNWKSNGWLDDGNGDTCLRLNGDARAVVNFKPFAKDFKLNGKTIEFEFLVRDVNNRDTVVINCYDGQRGFLATPDTAFLQSSGTKVSCRYKDEERIRVAVTIEHADSLSRFVSIYLDGILSGVQRYTTTDSFEQQNPLTITLGSSLCGLDIYAIRVYDKALSTPQLLSNYIADKTEPTTKLKLITDNDILDENGKISYDRVKALGQIPIVTFTGPMPTYKGDKKKKVTRMKFEDPLHPEMNFDVLLDQIDVQGTSSQFYVRKNWKVTLPEERAHIPGAIPAKVFCIKVDYAEATGTHNTGTANYVETFYDRNEVILPPQKDNPKVRTTVQGFPCILFEKASEDSEPVFSSKGNFNYDKDAEDTFGFTKDYENFGVECWEFCNNTSDSVNFVGPVPKNWLEDFEPRYVPESANFERIEELQELAENAASGKATMTDAQRQELSRLLDECIVNFKEMHDWVLSTATYKLVDGKRVPIEPVPLENAITYGETTYTEDCEEYRLAKFKYEFTNYFNLHYSSIYYVFTLFALMTDQRAKNMFLTRWKDSDGRHRWYPYFYDNDTIFGINNEGALVFDYYHEDIDQLGSSNVYNGQNSILWNNFRICFPQEIQETYATLRSNKKITYDAIINQYVTLGSDKWSATIYNEDAEYKYITMARQLTDDGDVDASNLYQVRGPGEHHLRYFISNRLNYCDGKWYAGDYPDDYIFLRIYTPTTAAITDDMSEEQKAEIEASNARIQASLNAVKADPSITVTPYSDMYAGVRYKSGTLQQKRLTAGESYKFSPLDPNETFGDTETAIYGASELSSLGDLSGLYCGVISLGKAGKLVELIIGNESPNYHNDNFREISVGSNRLLRKIDLRNCSGLGIAGKAPQKTLDLSGCPNIEYVYTEGTNLESVTLPESGYIKTLHLPVSINTLVIRNQQYISDFYIESFKNIKTLCIENSALDTNAILAACRDIDGKYTVERVRLTGIDWKLDNADFVKTLFPKFDSQGNIIGGIRGIDENNNNLDNAYLFGTCHIKKLTGAEYAEIKAHYPYLDITYDEMTANITFMSTDGTSVLYSEQIINKNSTTQNCFDPVLTNKIAEPVKESTAEFDFKWIGWSRKLNDKVHADALLNIAGDRILYPAFQSIRRSYTITFINPTASEKDRVLAIVQTLYGSDSVYSGPIPLKQDAASPDLYAFTGWHPAPTKITGPMTCYAQFTILDDKWYTIGINDISDCVDYNGNIFDGYSLNTSNQTMSITECNNNFNAAIKIPVTLNFDSGTYTIKSLGGFADHTRLELVSFPNSLIEILARAFYNCYNLFELTLPESVQKIGRSAFQGCIKIKEIYIPATLTSIGEAAFADCRGLTSITIDENNPRYTMVQNCLIDRNNNKLLQGLSNGVIPQDGSVKSLGQYCFSNTGITSAWIPEGIDIVPNNAFSRCESLVSVRLPSTLHTLDATCFAWCPNLKTIKLPDGLVNIRTYIFNSCALEDVEIPASVENILERSFGDIASLKTVTFKKQLDENGDIRVPYIHPNAFINSGSTENPIIFRLPWAAEQTPDAPWGAKNYELIFDYEETN